MANSDQLAQRIAELPELPEPLEIIWPELNSHALGCGVEDRGIHDRYEAAEYGWQDGVDKAAECVPDDIYDAETLRSYALAAQAPLIERIKELEKRSNGLSVALAEATEKVDRLSASALGLEHQNAELEKQNAAKQAEIDRLMLEFCPNEMTPEQIEEWGKHQRLASAQGELKG